VLREQQRRLLFVEGRPYMAWVATDTLMERIAVAQLCELSMGSQQEIAGAFGTSIRTVHRYHRAFDDYGSAGLLGGRTGPKSHWKITPEARAKILYLFFAEGMVEYQQIKQRLAGWGEEVAIGSIRQVLVENGLRRERSVVELASSGGLFDSEASGQQLELGLDSGGRGRQVGRPEGRRKSECSPGSTLQRRGSEFAQGRGKARRS
jgi:transposase